MLDRGRNKVEDLINDGYDFSASQYLKEGWEIYKEEAFSFVGFLLVTFVISLGISYIPRIGSYIQYFVVGPALSVGYFIVAHRIKRNEYEDFGEFFKGFSFLKEIIPAAFTMMVIYLIAFSPTIYSLYSTGIIDWYQEVLSNPFSPPPVEAFLSEISTTQIWIMILNIIPIIYLGVAFTFTYMYIVFYDMGFWEAIESSRKVITRRWFAIFGYFFMILGIFLLVTMFLGLFTTFTGVLGGLIMALYTIIAVCISPFIYCGLYAAFADIMELNSEYDESDGIIDHLVD